MACLYPVALYDGSGNMTTRPCGQCLQCKIDYSRQFAIRAVHEASLHDENSYITLTFDDEHLPKDKSVNKRHVQDFMRSLRSSYDHPIRYLACGEYGDQKDRPHYHLCLFGHQFEDLEVLRFDENKKKGYWKRGHDHTLFRSGKLESIWTAGFSTVGNLTYESAAYVARYVTKKITGTSPQALQLIAEKYKGRKKEFALMSRMPGIGHDWFMKNYRDIYPKDYYVHDGKKFLPPRYYDTLYGRMFPKKMEEIKQKRKENHDLYKRVMYDGRESNNREKYIKELSKNFKRDMKCKS